MRKLFVIVIALLIGSVTFGLPKPLERVEFDECIRVEIIQGFYVYYAKPGFGRVKTINGVASHDEEILEIDQVMEEMDLYKVEGYTEIHDGFNLETEEFQFWFQKVNTTGQAWLQVNDWSVDGVKYTYWHIASKIPWNGKYLYTFLKYKSYDD